MLYLSCTGADSYTHSLFLVIMQLYPFVVQVTVAQLLYVTSEPSVETGYVCVTMTDGQVSGPVIALMFTKNH
jgi:hypothetical protein